MTRRTGALPVFLVIWSVALGCAPRNGAQPPSTPSDQAAIAEATRLDTLVEKLYGAGKFQEATPSAERSVALRQHAQGPRHPDVATSLNNLAALYKNQGAYAKAEPLYLRSLDIRERALGPRRLDVAESLNNLALVYYVQGAYAKAEPLYLRALDIFEKALGPMHPDVAASANNLALLYTGQGAYAKAKPLYLRALDIREKALGAMHPDVAQSLNNLGMLYQVQGAYAKAEPLYLRALEINEKVRGAPHLKVADNLNNLAVLYTAQGAYTKAEPLDIRALDIREKVLGTTHPEVAASLNNLATLYYPEGAYTKAELLLVRALDIDEKAIGAMHPDVATDLNNLAAFYWAQGAYTKAAPLHIRALDVREKVLGVMHPDVAISLNNLAGIYRAQGAYAKAQPLYLRALDIRERVLDKMHPDVALSLYNLAVFYWDRGAYAMAVPLMSRAAEIQEGQLRLELARLSEPRKRALLMLLQRRTNSVVSLHADAMPSNSQALELAFTTVLRRKARVTDSLAGNQLSLRAHLTPAIRDELDQFAAASTELSTRLRAPFDPRTAASRAEAITDLRTRVEELESALNAASAEFRVQSEPITIAKIRAALPPRSALVEFVRYRRFDPRQAQPQQEARYVAYVLPWKGPPQAVALGEAAAIDAQVDAVLAAMHKDTSADAAKAALQRLDTLVFGPLRGQLANVSHVILSPDDKLNLVPFEALVDPQGHHELERRLVSYVTSGRDLLRLATRRAPRSSATIVAAPDYGPPALNGLGTFRPLEGAAAEVAELPAYFVQARTLIGEHATKAALAATIGPAVLHIATHGFYARDAVTTPTSSTKSASSLSSTSPPRASPPPDLQRGIYVDGDPFASLPPPPADDPTDALDRAGLAMAGANVRPNGIVTARELASYDWWGTKLVVLAACETGVGAVPSGEGVYGMRRALVLAGAEAQVVSLWNANDASTRELMRAFYGELARGTGRAEALRRAKLRLLRQPRFAHPYYWAAFIPAGDWTPLDPHLLKRQEPRR
jgi:CHAT domain-containing protein/Tfp pilus assembly protein PilF